MTLVYVVGPYRAASAWQVEQNVRSAEALALEVWRAGGVAICPHANTRYFQGELPDTTWLAGDLEILCRCAAVLLCPNWQNSEGSRRELSVAKARGIPIFKTIDDLRPVLRGAGNGARN